MGHASQTMADREHRAADSALAPAETHNAADAEKARRSNYGSVPGEEFPAVVYVSVLAAFAWIMLASWLAFAGDGDAALALGIAIVLAIVFFALPIIIRHMAVTQSLGPREARGDFASS